MSAFIHLSVDILLPMNLLEEHRRNGKKQPKLISRDRPTTAEEDASQCGGVVDCIAHSLGRATGQEYDTEPFDQIGKYKGRAIFDETPLPYLIACITATTHIVGVTC